jgi:hypothetical protein
VNTGAPVCVVLVILRFNLIVLYFCVDLDFPFELGKGLVYEYKSNSPS